MSGVCSAQWKMDTTRRCKGNGWRAVLESSWVQPRPCRLAHTGMNGQIRCPELQQKKKAAGMRNRRVYNFPEQGIFDCQKKQEKHRSVAKAPACVLLWAALTTVTGVSPFAADANQVGC